MTEVTKQYKYMFFDLDGTITDSKPGITRSVAYALKYFGIEIQDLDSLDLFIGPPLSKSFEDLYGFDEEKAKLAVEKYREYYRVTGIFENSVYPGVEDMLKFLKSRGTNIVLATSKPEVFARQIIEYFNLMEYFDFIAGSELDGRRSEKEDVIRYAIQENGITELSKVLMIGDRKYDIEGAKSVGIDSAGVLYGFGTRGELEEAGADYLFSNAMEICDIF